MDRADSIKYKLMPNGHIRAFQSDTPDLRGVSEMMIHLPCCVSPTIIVAHTPKILITDEGLYTAIRNAVL